MDARAHACARGQVVASAYYLKRNACFHHKPPIPIVAAKSTADETDTTNPTDETPLRCRDPTSALAVLTTRDLFVTIATYQNGVFPVLRPMFTLGHWTATFLPHEFVAMHLGPHGRTREALLRCILEDRLDLIRLVLRCYPHYSATDYRFNELVDAAFALDRLDIARFLMAEKPGSRCTARALDLAAGNGHMHIVQYLHEHEACQGTAYGMEKAKAKNYKHIVAYLADLVLK
ncbi:Aste57867_8906 [Aphanomyces stellatus]|uniref:Aste57867_8906 protein n=1 Tax=Aphanomyces stellatus TaxID=120398 RepID=A0A485KLF3_9STRA|nr:hypothetical protein As57867_008871 [Aphanomyces stellatus]VFT85790.1 Aste57867_8906 [Aphanomyces stellatus]